jgi:rRNA maturation protein Nop10
MEKTVTLSVKCPHCGESFMDENHMLNEHPGIKINIEAENGKGTLWLCAIYDCFMHESDIKLKDKEQVKFKCPHCNSYLCKDIKCEVCGAPMADMHLNVGGRVNVCSRKGCKNHYVVFEDLNDAMNLFDKRFNA